MGVVISDLGGIVSDLGVVLVGVVMSEVSVATIGDVGSSQSDELDPTLGGVPHPLVGEASSLSSCELWISMATQVSSNNFWGGT